jgi:hypothetical protein
VNIQFEDFSGKEVDPFESTVAIVRATKDGFDVIGTGFYVTSFGILVSAAHILKEWTRTQDLLVFHKPMDVDSAQMRQIVRVWTHPTIDVGIALSAEVRNGIACYPMPGTNRSVRVSADIPPIGSSIACWGYPQSPTIAPPESNFDGHLILIERMGSIGVIEDHFPEGRDSVMQPGECIQTTLNSLGGASGGPVFNTKGEVFGVVSSGLGEHLTYVAPLRDAVNQKIIQVFDPITEPKAVSILDYVARY